MSRFSSRSYVAIAGIRVKELLGGGAIMQVWSAESADGRKLALKTPRREWAKHPGALEMLRREHAALVELEHAQIVATAGLIEHRDSLALVMEYLGGGDLVPLAGAEPHHWIKAARDVVGALTHMHARGWVHGDIKARNVLFDERDRPRLVDFGSAARIGSPRLRGGVTRAHAPPHAGTAVTAADDSFALAVLIYELMHGCLPLRASGSHVDRLPPQVAAECRKNPALDELRELVLVTLDTGAAEHGSLCRLSDVIESVLTSTGRS